MLLCSFTTVAGQWITRLSIDLGGGGLVLELLEDADCAQVAEELSAPQQEIVRE